MARAFCNEERLRRMARLRRSLSLATLVASLLPCGCQYSPLAGPGSFTASPGTEELKLADEAWAEIAATTPASSNEAAARLVRQVGERLAAAADRPERWEFRLLAADEPLAFALPRSKVGVSEGMLAICETEAGLAAAMAHQMAHVLAGHGQERISRLRAEGTRGGIRGAFQDGATTASGDEWKLAWGLNAGGSEVVPFSRKHLSEADSISLTLMSRAGYDPSEAPRFWERLALLAGPEQPHSLTLHPCDASRLAHFEELISQAIALYEAAPQRHGVGAVMPSTPSSGIRNAHFEGDAGFGVTTAALSEEFVPPVSRGPTGGNTLPQVDRDSARWQPATGDRRR